VGLLAVPPGEHVPTADQRIVLHDVPWSHFEAQLALRGDASVPRSAYLDGALELTRPGARPLDARELSFDGPARPAGA
jgi:hypothetical protein